MRPHWCKGRKAEYVRIPRGETIVFDAANIPTAKIGLYVGRIIQLDPVRVLAKMLDRLLIAGHDLINDDLRVAVRDPSDICQGKCQQSNKPAAQVWDLVQESRTLRHMSVSYKSLSDCWTCFV